MTNSHKKIIAKTKIFEAEDCLKSHFLLISSFGLAMGMHFVTIFSPYLSISFLSSLIHGLLIVRLFGIYHDYAHGAILRKSNLSFYIMKFFGLYALTPASVWRRSHNFHHSHNSKLAYASIGSYPIISKNQFEELAPSEKKRYLTSRHPATIFFGYFTVFLFGMSARPALLNFREHKDAVLSLTLHVSLGILYLYFGSVLIFFLAFLLPHFISSAIGSYLFYAQHNFPNAEFRKKEDWNYVEAALKSSSYMKMPRIFNWFTANIGYHHIHHINPRIPFYRLPEAMQNIAELQSPKTTSLSLKEIICCLSLKVWDESTGKLAPIEKV